MSSSTMEVFTPSPNLNLGRSVLHLEIEDIFNRLVEKCYSNLKKYAFIRPLKGDARRDYGDYVCLSLLEICKELRKKNPYLFDRKTPVDIAREILRELPFEDTKVMINGTSLQVHDAGIITFQLDGSWIAHRINLMLTNGIDTWAPIIYKREARAVFVSTTNSKSSIRATWIKDALLHMFLYSGLHVFDDIVFADRETETMRHGVRKLRADIMVFMTPHQQREYIHECFNAARRSNWFRDGRREATLACCGYLSSDQEYYPVDLWHAISHQYSYTSLSQIAWDAGYTRDTFLGCLLKYTVLKSHRLAELAFKIEEMIDNEGNTLVNLLRTKAKIRRVIDNYNVKSPGILSTSTKALAGHGERELGLHLVEFTGVIETACRGLVPHVVCEYLFDLSKLFMSYYRESYDREAWPGKTVVGLCRATEVVMCECFRLLGIDPSSELARSATFVSSVERPIKGTWANDDRYSQSRFELFTMIVNVPHPDFDEGSIFGNIWVKDANGERADGWTMLDDKDNCFVSYFKHEWHKQLDISYGSYIPFGNPSCGRSVSVSSSFEVDVVLHALNKNKDRCHLIFHGKHDQPLSIFWDDEPEAQCGTLELVSDVGCVLLNYILLKNAVDASMELTFRSSNPAVPVRISGSIMAYYGDVVVKNDILGRCKAVMFKPNKFELIGEQGVLPLHKSLLAVPANGCLKIEAFLMDVESRKVIVRDTKDFRPRPGNADHNWCIEGGEYSFNLRVAWSL